MGSLESIFQTGDTVVSTVPLVILAMVVSTILSIIITKVYTHTYTGDKYSQSFVHTIIIMSVVVSVVMNVISGNAGVAFGLFAVFSLIRFRSAVTDAKDIAYIFFGLCVGMTSGLFRFDLAIILTVFASVIFYILHKIDYGKGRHTQIVKITVPENMNESQMFEEILQEFTMDYSLRKVETTNLGTMILYTYAIQGKADMNDKVFLDRIREKNANLNVSLTYVQS